MTESSSSARRLPKRARLISGLRPPVLDEQGIVAGIEYLVAEHQHGDQPRIDFHHDEQPERLAPPLEGVLFRITQECLTNACRYSQSGNVRVELRRTDGRVRLDGARLGRRVSIRPESRRRILACEASANGSDSSAAPSRFSPHLPRGSNITIELPVYGGAAPSPTLSLQRIAISADCVRCGAAVFPIGRIGVEFSRPARYEDSNSAVSKSARR